MTSDEGDEHEIRFRLSRIEWLRTEWPALVFRVLPSALLLLGIALATARSPWWALLLLMWWPLGGAGATGLVWFLVGGTSLISVRVRPSGAIFVAENGAEPRYAHWVGFHGTPHSFVLSGGDGRYQLVLPKRALTSVDHAVLRERTGVDLLALGPGQEALLRVNAAPAQGVSRSEVSPR